MSRALLARQNLRLRHLGRSSRAPCRIIVTTDSELPALAWVCRREGPLLDFTVGPGVETGNRGLFEGVWTGDFARMVLIREHAARLDDGLVDELDGFDYPAAA